MITAENADLIGKVVGGVLVGLMFLPKLNGALTEWRRQREYKATMATEAAPPRSAAVPTPTKGLASRLEVLEQEALERRQRAWQMDEDVAKLKASNGELKRELDAKSRALLQERAEAAQLKSVNDRLVRRVGQLGHAVEALEAKLRRMELQQAGETITSPPPRLPRPRPR